MKTPITNLAKRFWLYLPILLATLICTGGCITQAPDPLAGWKMDFAPQLDPVIAKDCQDYIQKLPSGEKKFAGISGYFEDGTGQHAVKIEVALYGTDWGHILIYDKENKRIKVIKYKIGHYAS